ncbi:ABC transporter ATP-binding protein [Pseudothermotoga thermarum]|uniref:ABC transporter related protein n=1 Tax=Pseudothermotoga thermarum DSM 5069 TaxID=688269 RepID=F7YUC4_9THEM|nr:ABC transporter ATP-binding protein [Pseudothermotoga thermarum]AEH51323.1 ABC transporter related protein [Pseudothermotoga thermarum DSM 5069]
MLEVRNITVQYGPVVAVKDVSMVVRPSSITVLLGANGAGKTSTLMAIAGLNRVSSGQIIFDGERIDKLPAYEIVKRGLVLCPESKLVFHKMTVMENLKVGAYTRKDDVSEELDFVFQLFPRLKERAKQLAGTLSGGERQMLVIARSLMAKPKCILFDEPSMGLAPNLVAEIMKVIQKIKETGKTILLVEQNAYSALKIADYAYIMKNGRIVFEGYPKDLLKDKTIVEKYLGG